MKDVKTNLLMALESAYGEFKVQIVTHHPLAKIPAKGSDLSAGFDLYAVEDGFIPTETTVTVPLGFSTSMPPNIHGRIESRSGMALKGLVVLTGVIDADYRGEWKVILRNVTSFTQSFKAGDRIAQVVFRHTPQVAFERVSELSESSRGAGGFGSTGQQ